MKEIDSVKGYPSAEPALHREQRPRRKVVEAGALFGESPAASQWQMSHGAGGVLFTVTEWENDARQMQAQAEKAVR